MHGNPFLVQSELSDTIKFEVSDFLVGVSWFVLPPGLEHREPIPPPVVRSCDRYIQLRNCIIARKGFLAIILASSYNRPNARILTGSGTFQIRYT